MAPIRIKLPPECSALTKYISGPLQPILTKFDFFNEYSEQIMGRLHKNGSFLSWDDSEFLWYFNSLPTARPQNNLVLLKNFEETCTNYENLYQIINQIDPYFILPYEKTLIQTYQDRIFYYIALKGIQS